MNMETKIPNIHQQKQDTIYHVLYEMETEYFWCLLKVQIFLVCTNTINNTKIN